MKYNLPLILLPLALLAGWKPLTIVLLTVLAVYIYALQRKA
ncbi:hypothetical protein [Corynebacterium renale]|nr:hypothetical protein [Corynebacterium renale]STC97486.1 Uncharacterised protein [Corynebacterium renale]STD70247.1 Uncharacterised protein [Corynebacterium renale]